MSDKLFIFQIKLLYDYSTKNPEIIYHAFHKSHITVSNISRMIFDTKCDTKNWSNGWWVFNFFSILTVFSTGMNHNLKYSKITALIVFLLPWRA